MDLKHLVEQIKKKQSFLCVGLDSDLEKIPTQLLSHKRPVFEFNKAIIDATAPYSIAYKPNTAFYESRGAEGWIDLELTANYIKTHYPEIFLIADAKRGDIGNTSGMYAEAFFKQMPFDSVTVAPYMGADSVKPFLAFKNKFVILLALTSNESAADFQYFSNRENIPLFTEVIKKSSNWGTPENLMFVVGATKASMLSHIREYAPNNFLLVPGVGAQGGSLQEVAKYGMTNNCGLIVNASRSILFAGKGEQFAEASAREAQNMQSEMAELLKTYTT
ncbi:MAG: orotidine-5'-phosphate decarboxylase [Bacteroidota bacterium]|nr:MAG: orotidine-5'-phosphate decarboxylase [Bacteroidota bacterium]